MYTQFYSKLISCLGTGWKNKNQSYLIQLLVSIISDYSQIFSEDFLEFLLNRRHLKNL